MSTEAEILSSSRVIAVVGLSATPDRPSYRVASYLKENGYKIIPVNPETGKVLGEVCYPDLSSIPEPVDVVDIFRRSEEVPAIVEEAIKIGAKAVWMQEGVINKEAAARAREAGLLVVMDRCMLKKHKKWQSGMAKIIAVCSSKKKGTKKEVVAEGVLREGYGLVGDAHADCCTHRQVSLLATESINKMRSLGFDVGPGDFAENLTTGGIDLVCLPIDTKISIGDEVILEISQIGKECHSGCVIYRQIGKCIMPKEGVFAKVIKGGLVKAGDTIRVLGVER